MIQQHSLPHTLTRMQRQLVTDPQSGTIHCSQDRAESWEQMLGVSGVKPAKRKRVLCSLHCVFGLCQELVFSPPANKAKQNTMWVII